MHAAATAGGCEVENRNGRARWHRKSTSVRLPATYHRTHGIRYFHGCYSLGDDQLWGVTRLRKGGDHTLAALKSRHLWVIAGFLLFYYFSPGIDTPLYFYMTDRLKFSQPFIGALGSIQAVGWIAAAFFYSAILQHLALKKLLNLSILTGVLATLAFVLLSGMATAIAANFCYGAASMITAVASLGLAADYCPKRSEGFAFAALIAVVDLSGSLADNVGSFLFEHVFHNEISPLILVAAAFTAVNFLLVPLLGLKDGTVSRRFLSSARIRAEL